jgi:hypothetical protein
VVKVAHYKYPSVYYSCQCKINQIINLVFQGGKIFSACPLVTILPAQQLSSAAAAAVAAAAGVWPPTSVDDMPHKGKSPRVVIFSLRIILLFLVKAIL